MANAKGIRAGRAFVELFTLRQAQGKLTTASSCGRWAAAQACFIRAGIANEVRNQ
jgi:hypothetical protein